MKTRSKLMAALAMLLVSTIMMTTASFAWFTISTAPEIKSLTTNVVVNDNLEIALAKDATTKPTDTALGDTGKSFTWGNLVDVSTTETANNYSTTLKMLRPSKLDGGNFKFPTYGNDGRPNTELGTITVDTTYPCGELTGTDGRNYGYYVDVWVRSNVTGNLKFVDAAGTKRSSAGVDGEGTYFTSTNTELASSVRIAYQFNSGTITAATAGTATGGKVTFSGTLGELTADTPTHVRIFVFQSGEGLYNPDAVNTGAVNNGTLNIQFTMDGLTSMDAADTAATP